MTIKKAVLRSFDSSSYTAVVQLSGSDKSYLEGITVARNIPSGEMLAGRRAAVLFFDENNAGDAVVVAVYA
ncbi:MAG: hypothetical protein C4542_00185 [Dehalococcoidia bacterium]|nr:MAG: hypothetical protein C4542_00185 [Dehalococcoidia bacterium]